MDFASFLRDAFNSIFPPQKMISPLPESQTLNTPEKIQKAKQLTPATSNLPQPNLKQTIDTGLSKYAGGNTPLATLSGQLAQAGTQLQQQSPKADPLLPVILAIMETGGGRNLSSPNNLYNIGPSISYPSPETAILGGGPQNQLGLLGLLRQGGNYQDYLNSGNLSDFFNKFTPPGSQYGNPTLEELLSRYNNIRSNFQ